MRGLLLCGVAVVGMGLEARAADMPDFLRGSSPAISMPSGPRWDGFYVGGHVGWSVPGIDFTNNTGNVQALLGTAGVTGAISTPLNSVDTTATHFGGFAGYQQQWDGAVVGLEGTYNWIDKSVAATNTLTGGRFGGLPASVAGSATAHVIDYGTIRMKGGWAASSFFMPYATFGVAVGRMDINRAVAVTPLVAAPFTVSENLKNQFGYGYAAGVGVDFCLMANLFARLEYEYVQFPDFHGLNAHLHNVRAGAAFKF